MIHKYCEIPRCLTRGSTLWLASPALYGIQSLYWRSSLLCLSLMPALAWHYYYAILKAGHFQSAACSPPWGIIMFLSLKESIITFTWLVSTATEEVIWHLKWTLILKDAVAMCNLYMLGTATYTSHIPASKKKNYSASDR